MAVANGQKADQTTFNEAFMSKTQNNTATGNQEFKGNIKLSADGKDEVEDLQAAITDKLGSSHATNKTTHGVTGEIVGTSDEQTLTNKSFGDAITMAELEETPSSPDEGKKKLYPKSDGYVYILDKDGKEIKVGSGGAGSGGINLESSPYAQDGDNDWATFDDGATATGVDLTGGTATATFAADKDDTSILSGDFQGAYKLSYTAADHQGEGVSKAFSIPKAFRDKGYFLVTSRYSATAALATGDMIFRAYDVTNSELIATKGLTDYKIPGIAANGTGMFTVIVPIQPDTASVRLGFMRAVTTATAHDFCFSDFRVGPPQALLVPGTKKQVVIDLTGSGNFTGGKIIVSRDGADILISQLEQPTFSSNHSPASAAGLIPSWAVPADTQFSANFTATLMVRTIIGTNGTFSLNIRDHSGANSAQTTANCPPLTYTLDEDDGSNIVDVAEMELKAAKAELKLAGNQTVNTADPVLVEFTSVVHDPYGLASSVDKGFKIKSPGDYRVTTYIRPSNMTAGDLPRISVLVNGVSSADFDFAGMRGTTEGFPATKTLYGLKKDDVVTITFDSGTDNDYIIGGTGTFFQIEQLIDLTAIAAIAGQNKFIVKTLSGDVTSDGAIADLAVSGLTIGKTYKVGGHIDFRVNQGGTDNNISCTISCGADSQVVNTNISGGNQALMIQAVSFKFTAKATSLSFTADSASANSYISKNNTRITVTELPNSKEVSSF